MSSKLMLFPVCRRIYRSVLIGFIFFIMLSVSHATSIRSLSVADLARESSLIIVGTVTDSETYRDAKNMVFTNSNVRVDEVIFGNGSLTEITVKQYGGKIGDIEYKISGGGSLVRGESVVLFLSHCEQGEPSYCLPSLAVSKYQFGKKLENGDRELIHNLLGITVVNMDGSAVAGGVEKTTMRALRQKIAEAVK